MGYKIPTRTPYPITLKLSREVNECKPLLSGKIPPAKSDLPRHATCALVGNGPGLRLEGMGEIIDRHDAVYRFNAYNLGQRQGKMQARLAIIHLTSVCSPGDLNPRPPRSRRPGDKLRTLEQVIGLVLL
jgi:hypothetical protein